MDLGALLISALALLFGHGGDHTDRPTAPAPPREAHGAPAPGLAAGVPAAIAALGALGVARATRRRVPKTRSDD